MTNIKDYYLDLDGIMNLSRTKRNLILDFYRDMLAFSSDGRHDMFESYFNTLEVSGWIKNRVTIERQTKLNELTNNE
jgi:hypothetical protein